MLSFVVARTLRFGFGHLCRLQSLAMRLCLTAHRRGSWPPPHGPRWSEIRRHQRVDYGPARLVLHGATR